ncbi:MAG: hypothetical protein ABIX01_20835 [Chitinophagaceae bacterium]
MKKTIISVCLSVTVTLLFAQSNNPFKQRGEDLVASLGIITADPGFNPSNGFDQATIDRYKAMIPSKSDMNESLAGEIVKTIKSPDFNFEKFVRESPLSVFSQDILLDVFNAGSGSKKGFSQKVTNAVNAVNANGTIERQEKELVLTLLSFAYEINNSPVAGLDRKKQHDCLVTGPDGTGTLPCWMLGAAAGAILGGQICGGPCAIGGAIIGSIAGALS